MSGSSEEEIYKRRKKHTQIKEDLENLFEDVHEESSEPEFKYNEEHLLVEIFGTGHEYDYIYKPENTPKEELNSQKMQFTDIAPKFYYYENDIYAFLLRRSNYNETQKKSVKLLLQGYSIYYVFFHCELCFSLKVLYEIKKRINEYVKIKRTVEEGVDIGPYENLMEYTKVMQYNEKNIGEEKVFGKLYQSKYILSVNELYENVVNCEEVNICNQPNNLEEIVTEMANNENTTSHDFLTRLAKLYATHPLFIKIVINHGEHKVAEHYTGKDSSSNFRRQIIENAISNINNLSILNDRHRQKVYKEQVKESISNTIIDMILNGSRPIKGQECVFGVMEYKNQFYCSVVDYKGKCIDYFVHKEVESIGKNCEAHKPVYVVFASLEKTLRYSIPKLKGSIDCDLIVVDNEMTYKMYGIEDLRNYAIHLAKRVMWPEIELCKIRDNRIKILHDEKYKVLTNDEYFEAFDFGIKVGLSFIGIDINKLLYADYLILLPYIGLDAYFLEQINDYGEIPSLKVLKDMGLLLQKIEKDNALLLLDPINDFDNSCVFLRCYNDILLDQFMIHPKNYGYAKVLASAAFGEGPSDDSNPIIKKVIQNPDQITKFNMSAIAQTGNSEMINIKNYLLVHKRKQFTGVTDEALFIDLVGMVKEKEYEGQIKRIDKSYFIASVFLSDDDYIRKPVNGSNTVDIFVKANTSSYFSNQYISLAISDPAFSNLSYSGYVVEKKKLCKQRFIESIWYEDLSCPASQDYLLQNKKTLLVRRSSKDHKTCVVTVLISVDPKIFLHLNLVEGESNYKFNDKVYDSVDEFISRYVKKMLQQVKRIKENDHFCRNKESCKADLMFKKYVIYLSEQYLGRLVFAYNNDNKMVEEYIKIEDELVFGNKRFKDFRQFLKHRVK